jgi:hypothetical protein
MGAPDVEHEPFITLNLTLRRLPIGTTPYGARVEVPFEGTATSELLRNLRRPLPIWDGYEPSREEERITRCVHAVLPLRLVLGAGAPSR